MDDGNEFTSWLKEIAEIKEINRKKRAEYRKDYYEKNRDMLIAKRKTYQKENAEHVKEYNRAYYAKNKEAKK